MPYFPQLCPPSSDLQRRESFTQISLRNFCDPSRPQNAPCSPIKYPQTFLPSRRRISHAPHASSKPQERTTKTPKLKTPKKRHTLYPDFQKGITRKTLCTSIRFSASHQSAPHLHLSIPKSNISTLERMGMHGLGLVRGNAPGWRRKVLFRGRV